MKPLKRFKKGGWVLGYIPNGYCGNKHLLVFRVDGLTRKSLETSCRYGMIITSDEREVDEIYWPQSQSGESYSREEMRDDNRIFFHLTEEEALMLLVQDI